MTIIVFDVALFRTMFPAFSNAATFPDEMLQMYWGMATCYVDDNGDYGWLQGDCRALVLNWMTAHLVALSVLIAAGQTPGLVQASTVDKISISLTPPALKNQWQWWMCLTPYGQQAFALLSVRSVGGFYISGLPETGAFRKVGGIF